MKLLLAFFLSLNIIQVIKGNIYYKVLSHLSKLAEQCFNLKELGKTKEADKIANEVIIICILTITFNFVIFIIEATLLVLLFKNGIVQSIYYIIATIIIFILKQLSAENKNLYLSLCSTKHILAVMFYTYILF